MRRERGEVDVESGEVERLVRGGLARVEHGQRATERAAATSVATSLTEPSTFEAWVKATTLVRA